MKIKSIIAGLALTVGSLFFAIEPAQAETCSTGTYNVAGINTFGGLPCSDPGTEINVTVRGLHDYGVSGGPTAYCSFIYVRKNLGTASKPNWSASTDTICDARPTPPPAPVVVPTPTPSVTPEPTPSVTPEPTPSATPPATQYCQGMVCSETKPSVHSVGGFAVVDSSGVVRGVIVGDINYFGNNDKVMDTEYMGCPVGCSIILQTTADNNGNVSGYRTDEATVTTYDSQNKIFTVAQNNEIVKTIASPSVVKSDSATIITSVDVYISDSFTVSSNPITGVIEPTVNSEKTVANISASEITIAGNSSSVESESLVIVERKTEEQLVEIINQSTFSIMKSKIVLLTRLLDMGGWLL
jgi:hypothetical protein